MDNYFYLNASNQQVGPVPAESLKAQGVGPNTLVWKQGMQSWTQASQVPELAQLFAQGGAAGQPLRDNNATQIASGGYQQTQQQSYQQPYQQSQQQVYQQQAYQQPAYQQPAYQQPGYQQPYQQQNANRPLMPNNYLVWSILVTILCCVPFGIVSIVYASKVSGLWGQGLYNEAESASKNAKNWAIAGGVTGGVFIIIYIIYVIAVVNTASKFYY